MGSLGLNRCLLLPMANHYAGNDMDGSFLEPSELRSVSGGSGPHLQAPSYTIKSDETSVGVRSDVRRHRRIRMEIPRRSSFLRGSSVQLARLHTSVLNVLCLCSVGPLLENLHSAWASRTVHVKELSGPVLCPPFFVGTSLSVARACMAQSAGRHPRHLRDRGWAETALPEGRSSGLTRSYNHQKSGCRERHGPRSPSTAAIWPVLGSRKWANCPRTKRTLFTTKTETLPT